MSAATRAPAPLLFASYGSREISLRDDDYLLYSYRPAADSVVISVGYQNMGREYELTASQCFVTDDGRYAYVQLLNSVGKDAVVRVHLMLYTPSGQPPGKGQETIDIGHIRE